IGLKEFEPLFQQLDRLGIQDPTHPEVTALREECLERMKVATRQYAKRQRSWIKNQMIPLYLAQQQSHPRATGEVPSAGFYLLDANQLNQWNQQVGQQGIDIAQQFVNGKTELPNPVAVYPEAAQYLNPKAVDPHGRDIDQWKKYRCSECSEASTTGEVVLNGPKEWEEHQRSRRHRRALRWLKKSEALRHNTAYQLAQKRRQIPDAIHPRSMDGMTSPANKPGPTPMVSQEKLVSVLKTIQALKNRGETEEKNPELAVLVNWVRHVTQKVQAQKQQQQQQPTTNVTVPSGISTTGPTTSAVQTNGVANASPSTTAVVQPAPPSNGPLSTNLPSQAPESTSLNKSREVPFTEAQLEALKTQILAYRLISKNLPLPQNVRKALFSTAANLTPEERQAMENPTTLAGRIVEAARKQVLDPASQALEKGYYSPYHLIQQYLDQPNGASVLQRLVVPGIVPVGVDPQVLIQERERRIATRIFNRIKELEDLPGNLAGGDESSPTDAVLVDGNGVSNSQNPKLRALIELKSLKLLEKQKMVRREIMEGMQKTTTLATAQDRTSFRRVKKLSKRDIQLVEKLERQHRLDREKRERQRHVEWLSNIVQHGRSLVQWHKGLQTRQAKMGRSVLQFHAHVEKEEQKRVERVSKERLNALKANDEEAYLKLLDQAKDSRISHLLEQTDQYLSSLTQALRRQQNDTIHTDPLMRGGVEMMEGEDGYSYEENQTNDYYDSAHRIKEVITEQPSIMVSGTLKDYQLKGLQWMVSLYNNRLNGILADEMGLGKTIQTISLITFLIEKKRQNGPFLIIVPLSTLPNWNMEFDKWAPSVRKVVYKGSPPVRRSLQQNEIRHGNFQVLLTTFEYIIKDRPVLSRIKWVHMIIDEGHRMKNVKSKLTQTINQYYNTRYRLILTGTPLQNNLPELWALLNFVLPRIFDSVTSFDEWFNTPFANSGGHDRIALTEEEALLVIRRLHKVLRPFLLRRLKKDVESELPDKVESVIKCRMSGLQSVLYNQFRKHGMLFTGQNEKGKVGMKGLNNAIMQLRKLCNHPFVFEEVEQNVNPTRTNNDTLYRVAGKFELLDRILPKLFSTGHRVLIFFQMTQVITIMEDFLQYRGWRYLRLDGSTKAEDRSSMLKVFNAPDSPYQAFLLSTRAGGLGLNLQTADTVIIFDSDWNPHQDLQAQDRAHRIGQTKEVRILRLITEKSVEENILARAQYKLDMDGKVIQAGKFDQKSTAEEREAYLRSLLEMDNEEAEAEEDVFDDEEINRILARGPDELGIFQQMDVERKERTQQEWVNHGGTGSPPERLYTEAEVPSIYFQEYDAHAEERELANLERRNRVKTQVMYDDVLSEEQWLDALENDVDIDELVQKKRESKMRRVERRRLKAQKAAGMSGSGGELLDVDSDGEPVPGAATPKSAMATPVQQGPRKRGRPRKYPLATPTAGDTPGSGVDGTPESAGRGRPRGRKRVDQDDTASVDSATTTGSGKRGGPGRGHKRRKTTELDPLPPTVRNALTHVFEQAYEAVLNCADPADGRLRSELFLELPSKRIYPQYYVIIRKPIAMSMIRKRMRSAYYTSVESFVEDFDQMFHNACTFNEEGSWVYVDACEMKRVFHDKLRELCPHGGEPEEYLAWKRSQEGNDGSGGGDHPSISGIANATPPLTTAGEDNSHNSILDTPTQSGMSMNSTPNPLGDSSESQANTTIAHGVDTTTMNTVLPPHPLTFSASTSHPSTVDQSGNGSGHEGPTSSVADDNPFLSS
ncbi:ATP-dependent DNA helicase Snf21, partial [Dispira parvispora]